MQKITENNAGLSEKDTELLNACNTGNIVRLRTLMWDVDDINVQDRDGNTPLHLACRNSKNNHNIISTLLGCKGIDVNSSNKDNNTPMHFLSINGDSRIVSSLLEANANPLSKNKDGNTPAHLYIDSNFKEGITVLLNEFYRPSLIVNTKNNELETIMHKAAEQNSSLVHRFLIKGGNGNFKNIRGEFPEDLCTNNLLKKVLAGNRLTIEKMLSANALEIKESDSAENNKSLALANKAKDFIESTKIIDKKIII
jgi:ankyrin repeat protein